MQYLWDWCQDSIHKVLIRSTSKFYSVQIGRSVILYAPWIWQRAYAFMDVCIDGELIGRIVYELFKNLCPETCANFIALCTGEKGHSSTNNTRLSYVNSIFHRVVVNGWVQGGGMSDITINWHDAIVNISYMYYLSDICEGSGATGESIFGKHFPGI